MYFWNLFFPDLHLGQIHWLSRSSKDIPGSVPVFGSPSFGIVDISTGSAFIFIHNHYPTLHWSETVLPSTTMGAVPFSW